MLGEVVPKITRDNKGLYLPGLHLGNDLREAKENFMRAGCVLITLHIETKILQFRCCGTSSGI